MTLNPNKDALQTALGTFLQAVLGAQMPIVVGQENRTPEPQPADFAVMWPLRRTRLATNVDAFVDCKFEASIAGDVMTVSSVDLGSILLGTPVIGPGVLPGTQVTKLLTGSGAAGTYQVAPAQSAPTAVMTGGTRGMTQETQVTWQVDVHGPNSEDNAQAITTAFRDEFAVTFFAGLPPPQNQVSPIHADDPRQLNFINAEEQFEDRWVIEVHLQVNPVVLVGVAFADAASVTVVDASTFPP